MVEWLKTNWQRKLFAFLGAILIWFFVSHSITATKSFSSIRVKIINLNQDKTIEGLLPNGYLSNRIALTLTGTKSVIENLEPSDFEVILDASNQSDQWVVQITKKNIVSLSPDIILSHSIDRVSHVDFVLQLSKSIRAKIPVRIRSKSFTPPSGYEFLSIWPFNVFQELTGPQEKIEQLQNQGLDLILPLNKITKEDLQGPLAQPIYEGSNEIIFYLPKSWKVLQIPLLNLRDVPLNDPLAEDLGALFLKNAIYPLNVQLPVRIFYPPNHFENLNPQTLPLTTSEVVGFKEGSFFLKKQLYVSNVSRLFLEIIENYLELEIIAAPPQERKYMQYGLVFVNAKDLEDTYVAREINAMIKQGLLFPKSREENIRRRFRKYMANLTLLLNPDSEPFHIESFIQDNQIVIREKPKS